MCWTTLILGGHHGVLFTFSVQANTSMDVTLHFINNSLKEHFSESYVALSRLAQAFIPEHFGSWEFA